MPEHAPNYTEFSDPRLASLYETLNPFGEDSEFFCTLAQRLGAKRIIDLGCGTGLLTRELSRRGHSMIGIDPSAVMLGVAQTKPRAESVHWIQGSYEKLDGLRADMILMTSHVAQFFLADVEWLSMLHAASRALAPGGHIVFDVRRLTDPPFRGWPTKEHPRIIDGTAFGEIRWWFELRGVEDGRVRYELHYLFADSGERIASLNELVFRSQDTVDRALVHTGFQTEAVYGAWDGALVTKESPEMIFVAKRNDAD